MVGGGEVSAMFHLGKCRRMEHGFKEKEAPGETGYVRRLESLFGVFLKCYTNAKLEPLGLSFISIPHNSKYL